MAIRNDYFKYLDHLGKTITLRDMLALPDDASAVALRHDVDHDLDLALEMAFWEKEKERQATYFVLNTAAYWQDPQLIEKCLQIQDFGHEVGIHVNVLSEWASGKTDNLESHLSDIIKPLREAGVDICGVSPHGDRMCYDRQFINYWCFSELKPGDPLETEGGLSGEGIRVDDEDYQISYPAEHKLHRDDGKTVALWTVSMEKLGLKYDAIHVPVDKYYTDSGGRWSRSDDPLGDDLSQGRRQVLMHPVYWKGPQKKYFFLSTARSGSKWLSNYLEKATSVTSRHEFTWNHTFLDDKLEEKKRTAKGFVGLIKNESKVEDLLRQSGAWISLLEDDYAEANVYLAHVMPLVKKVFPDVCLVHLRRDSKEVVRSIINRDWYDTPEDDRHPQFSVEAWNSMTQFQKSCWYVKGTNDDISRYTKTQLKFEQMLGDTDYLLEFLKELGIASYPRLAEGLQSETVNANYNYTFPAYDEWSGEQKRTYIEIEGSVHDDTNVVISKPSPWERLTKLLQSFRQRAKSHGHSYDIVFNSANCKGMRVSHCALSASTDAVCINPEKDNNAYVAFFGGKWAKLPSGAGVSVDLACYYRGSFDADIESDSEARLFVLFYGKLGELKYKRSLGSLSSGENVLDYSFRPRPDIYKFDMALHMVSSDTPPAVVMRSLQLEAVALSEEQR